MTDPQESCKLENIQIQSPGEQRADKGKRHSMSQRMEGIVKGLRFSQYELPVRAVFERTCQRAALLGEPEPTLWQVRQVCDGIAEEVKEIADGQYGDYRSYHRMTYRYHFDGSVIVYQIDFTRVDVLLKDKRPRGFHTKQAAEVIFNNDLRLLVIDNAEQLDAACYEFLHYLFAKTGCAILVVGLKQILEVIRDHRKFDNRAPLRIEFAVPSEEEILTLVLPHLSIPLWTFDPISEKDQALGRKLWASVTPSLRNVRAVLQNACLLADAEGKNTITHDMVKLGFQMTGLRRRVGGFGEDDQEEKHETQTEYEEESVRRQRAKKKDEEEGE